MRGADSHGSRDASTLREIMPSSCAPPDPGSTPVRPWIHPGSTPDPGWIRCRRIPSLVLALTAFSTAAAQHPDSTRRVTPRDTSSTPALLPAVQVTGSILPIAGPAVGSGIPARVSVTSRAELEAWKPRLISSALARQPGVSLYDDLGSLYKPTLVTRGFTAGPVVGLPQGVSVFLDGVPVNEPDAGQVNFDLLPLEHVRKVELLSGTASLLGPYSLGGAVNLLTRRGTDEPSGEVELTTGSYRAYSLNGSYSGPLHSGLRYYAGGGYARDGGWRQFTDANQLNGFLNVGRTGAHNGFNLQALAARGYTRTAGSLPLSVYRVKPDSNLSSGDFENIHQVHLALSGYRSLGAGLGAGLGSAVLYFRQSDAERFNVNQGDNPDVRNFSSNRTVGASADWHIARTLPAGTLGLRLGLGGTASNVHVTIHAERIDPGLRTDVESPIATLDAYTLADYARGPMTLSAGLRYDLVRVPFRNRLESARDTTSAFRRLSPRAGLNVALGRSGSLYASVGQSFRAPALIELACADPSEPCPLPFALGDDPPLAPVVATTYEVGGRWTPRGTPGPRTPFGMTASAFRTEVHNDIYLVPYNDLARPAGSSINGYFANLEHTRRAGVELGADGALGPVTLRADYAYTRATFQVRGIDIFSPREEVDGRNVVEPGDRLPLVPGHTASLDASLALPAGARMGVNSRYTGKRFLRGDEANRAPPLHGYWVTDLRAGYERAAWEVEAIVRNLLGANYAAFGTFNFNQGAGGVLERFLTPGQPRTVQLVVRRSLGSDRGPARP